MRSGLVSLSSDFMRVVGLRGYGWSSVTGTFSDIINAKAYHLRFSVAELKPSNGPTGHYAGLPVRCLASGA